MQEKNFRGGFFKKGPPVNEEIRAEELRVVGEKGENLGIMKKEEALVLAREKGLDLVEVSSQVSPPIAKIISYDKYRYQLEKSEKEKKKNQKVSEVRGIRITPRSAKNDLEVKMKKVVEFLEKGDKVEIQMFMRGREKANKDFARGKLEEFLKTIPVENKIISPIKFSGRGFNTQIVGAKKNN